MPLVAGHSISLILRVEPTDNRYGEVCHGPVGRSVHAAQFDHPITKSPDQMIH